MIHRAFASRASRYVTALASGVLLTLGASTVRAQSAEDVGAARILGAEGVQLAHDGHCPEAIDKLSRAEKLYHAPTILVELGHCQCEAGQVVEGTEALNRVARENLGANPPPAFVDAQNRAKAFYQQYAGQVAKLVISVEAPPGAQFVVSVDGKPVSSALFGVPRPTDPGERHVTVSGKGIVPSDALVTLSPGGQSEIALNVVLAPVQNDVLPPVDDPNANSHADDQIKDTPPPKPEPTAPNRVPMYVSYGVGTVGLVVGSIFGFSALHDKSSLDDRCKDKGCPAGSQSDIDALNRNANIATIGFAVAAVGAGLGTYFLLSEDHPSSAEATRLPAPGERSALARTAPSGRWIRAVIGLNGVRMEGTF
ncbi:MAG TPA: hypothetical protein VHM70_11605 [Polyangiaceae bacterium]|jgi:hypothetical protein|nr:hypothetical protein [Polyangiaceae bacterium]